MDNAQNQRPPAGTPSPADRVTNDPTLPGSSADSQLDPSSPTTDAAGRLFDFLSPAQSADEIGRLGHYRILKVLGHGGMGVVFLAEDVHLQRSVALKAMLPETAKQPTAKERFLREARAAAKLEHDHIIAIHQVGEERGVPYIAMPLLKGASLEEWLGKEKVENPGVPLPLAQVLKLGRDIALGLDAAHAVGLIHRDIKPANVWLDASAGGRVKILDFGLARPTGGTGDQHLTQAGAILGTPAYMAPEQARGEAIDGRADLFSLGVVLYRLCTGEMPFKGHDPITTLIAVATNEPTPASTLRGDLPQSLNDLVMRLIAKNPHHRPGSARDVVLALRKIESELKANAGSPLKDDTTEALPSRPTAPTEAMAAPRTAPVATSNRWKMIGIAAALAALIVAGVLLFWPTAKGKIRIEFNSDSLTAVLDKDGATIQGVDEIHELALPPGDHRLTVKAAGLEFETNRFVLNKGATVHLKVELLQDKVQVVQDGNVIGAKSFGSPENPAVSQRVDPFNGKDRYWRWWEGERTGVSQWVDLFNGKDLSGWTAVGKDGWSMKDGVVKADGSGLGYLMTDREYTDFEIELEYRLPPGGNSGVFLRAWADAPPNGGTLLEIQLLDDADPKYKAATLTPSSTGAVFGTVPPRRLANSVADKWHKARLRIEGRRVTVEINDMLLSDVNLDDHKDKFAKWPGFAKSKARIGLQMHSTSVEFRNVRLRELKGTTELFNGKDINGWTVRGKDGWTVKDGVLTADGSGIGYLLTDKEYGDFELDFDYRLPMKGNSGVFLRALPDVPGYGEQFLEIQLLDDENPSFIGEAFKPNLATGSVYRYAGPGNPANAPADKWNRMLIRVEGPRIEVSVNGTRITQANLNDFQDLFARSPGLGKEKGRVGLQMYRTPVEFKNVRLRELRSTVW